MIDKIRYFAEFAMTGERITTHIADGMPYTADDILLKFPNAVEISEEEQKLYLQGYIRGLDGKPKNVVSETALETIRNNKIEEIQVLTRNKLMQTDHEVVEYLELKNLTDKEYEMLKKKRQAIRDLRDSLIASVYALEDVDAIQAIDFK
jgi:hypothetical protein